MSHFAQVSQAPADPILGLTEQFRTDDRATKVNLGVGVYQDGDGKLPLLDAVRDAEEAIVAQHAPRGYLPIDGLALYDRAVQDLVFGADSVVLAEGRVATVQTLGGTGGLKVGADFLHQITGATTAWISTPSWENHRAVFTRAGFEVRDYRYYDSAALGTDVDGMLADLDTASEGDVVVLHACCHNPTGYDLTAGDWTRVIDVVERKNLTAFLDMAYQGFGEGIAEDGAVIGRFVDAGLTFLVANSFSKTFSLYGERVGGLSVVTASAEEAKRVLSQLKIMVRTNYSNPPTHGASLVGTVLTTPDLRAQWEGELAQMRERIKSMRQQLAAKLADRGVDGMSHITAQNGMFSYSGLSKEQMERLRSEFGVYGLDSGRICVAALNEHNLDYVADAIAAVS